MPVKEKHKEIHLDAPNVGELEKEYLARAIDSGFVSTIGPFVSQFEGIFARYLGTSKTVSTQSGTAALHMALYELGIGPGDEVIVPALTFAATANAVLYVGARPVIVDVDPKTWTIDCEDVQRNLSAKTKAIIPVHLYGTPCAMNELSKIAREKDIYLIEDATESLGATYNGQPMGTFGEMGCFSFNGNKVITTGGGGIIAGKNAPRLEHIKYLINQAKDSLSAGAAGFHKEMGFNYRMTNIEAAVGIAQMERLPGFLIKKLLFAGIYREELADVKEIAFQGSYAPAKSSFWLNAVTLNGEINLSLLQQGMKERGIATNRIFMPLTEFPFLNDSARRDCPRAKELYAKALCLPSSTLNSEEDIRYVCRILKEELRKNIS